MVTWSVLESNSASFIGSLQTKQILLVEFGVFHLENFVAIWSIIHGTPVLVLIWVDHGVLSGLHHGKLVHLQEVVSVGGICPVSILVVPACKLRILHVVCGLWANIVTEIVCLEQDSLDKWRVCKITKHLSEALAHGSQGMLLLEAAWES